jgi:polyisoprenoid-binding protein YceI
MAQPANIAFRPAPEGRFALVVEKTGVWSGRKHIFEFSRYNAKLTYDRSAPEKSAVELTVDAASATCNDNWVSEKDRRGILEFMQKDMLDSAHHPEIAFRSTGVVATGKNAFDVSGMLKIRGMEKPVKVSVTVDEREGAIVSVAGQAIVSLKDYGLKPPKAALGAIGTKNEMTVEFKLVPQSAGARYGAGY